MDEKDLQKKIDFDDYNRELAGVNSAKVDRFFVGDDASRNPEVRRRKEQEQSLRRQLDMLMMNPVFAAAYKSAQKAVDETQKMLNKAMSTTAQNIERLTELTADMEERTAKLEDGTAVFSDANGRLRTADGRHLSEAETASLLNPENLLSYDSYAGARDALQSARARQDSQADIQTEIDSAHDRMKEAKTPEELESIEEDVKTYQDEIKSMNSIESDFDRASTPTAQDMARDFKLEIQGVNL